MQFIGACLVVLGLAFVLLSVATAFVQVVTPLRKAPAIEKRGIVADEVNAIAALLTAIGKLPSFALMALTGLILIAAGQHLQAGLQLIRW